MQQHLPFTVLKHKDQPHHNSRSFWLQQHLPFTVLKHLNGSGKTLVVPVATALTVYGIETPKIKLTFFMTFSSLQQHLPFTVLKPWSRLCRSLTHQSLQQHLPFTVLKLLFDLCSQLEPFFRCNSTYRLRYWNCSERPESRHIFNWQVATALTVYGIETLQLQFCNHTHYEKVATALTVYGIETRKHLFCLG